MADDNVVTGAFGRPGLLPKEPDYQACQHTQVQVCPQQRTVECASCGQFLDAVHILLQIASKERSLWSQVRTAHNKKAALIQDIEVLQKEKRNLQQSVRRLRKRQPT